MMLCTRRIYKPGLADGVKGKRVPSFRLRVAMRRIPAQPLVNGASSHSGAAVVVMGCDIIPLILVASIIGAGAG